jgi:hypothetical protein
MSHEVGKRSIIDWKSLPQGFPTHAHDAQFWEHLGRTIATYGFLEEVLGKAVFAFTGTTQYSEEAVAEALEKWLPKLENALHQTLNPLIDVYVKSVKDHQSATLENLADLENDLRKAATMRNVLCHGSWRKPNAEGGSVPFFVNKQMMVFDTEVDIAFLQQTQTHVAELACAVINSVTHMGWQFPGGAGLGKPIWNKT